MGRMLGAIEQTDNYVYLSRCRCGWRSQKVRTGKQAGALLAIHAEKHDTPEQ